MFQIKGYFYKNGTVESLVESSPCNRKVRSWPPSTQRMSSID